MIALRDERALDLSARESLLDTCFGPERFGKTCERLRCGRLPAEGLARVVEMDGRLVATVRLWGVFAGTAGRALMLGPIAVDPALHDLGIGSRLIRDVLARATRLGHRAIVLVGDEPYYRRFGFGSAAVDGLWLPGPYDRDRFLGLELAAGALRGACGPVLPCGQRAPAVTNGATDANGDLSPAREAA